MRRRLLNVVGAENDIDALEDNKEYLTGGLARKLCEPSFCTNRKVLLGLDIHECAFTFKAEHKSFGYENNNFNFSATYRVAALYPTDQRHPWIVYH